MDLFQTEHAFAELQFVLGSNTSARWRLLSAGRFLDDVRALGSGAEPYVLELIQQLPPLVDQLDPVGLTPQQVITVLRRLEQVRVSFPVLEEVAAVTRVFASLRRALATLYAYAGDLGSAVAWLSGDELPALSSVGQARPMERLEQAVLVSEETGHTAAALREMRDRWREQLRAGVHGTVVPVVERPAVGPVNGQAVGSLRRLQVELYGPRRDGDELRADVGLFAAEQDMFAAPLQAARELLAHTHPGLARRYFAGRVRFDETGSLHSGRSADLAVAVLFYGAMLRVTGQREQYRIAADAAITGQVAEDGTVRPVEEEALRTKIQTVFFSWVNVLALPAAQLEQAHALLAALQENYPARRLDLVGVRHLREVFYDRRLTEHRRISLPRHLIQRAWQQKFSYGSVLVILVLTMAVGKLLYGPVDRNPVEGDFVGETLLVKNAAGEVLETIALRSDLHCPHEQLCTAFLDVNGDGQNEIIWAEMGKDADSQRRSYIHSKALGEATYRWSVPLTFDLEFPHIPEANPDGYMAEALVAGDFDRDGRPEVIAALSHHDYFPGLVVKLDAVTGQIDPSFYVHIGNFQSLAAADLNGDGIKEILVGGLNNAFGHDPSLVVLDPRRLSGHSPLRPDYRPRGVEPAREIAYILFPRGPLGEVRRVANPDVFVTSLKVDWADRSIIVYTEEGAWVDPLAKLQVRLWLLTHLNFDLEPIHVGTSSRYDQYVEQLIAQGVLEARPDYAYKQEFLERFRYWNGEGWQYEPFVQW